MISLVNWTLQAGFVSFQANPVAYSSPRHRATLAATMATKRGNEIDDHTVSPSHAD